MAVPLTQMMIYFKKLLELHKNIIVAKAVLYEDNKYYPKAFLDECLHKL